MKWILLVVLTVCGCYVPDEEPVNETGEALAVPVPLPGSPFPNRNGIRIKLSYVSTPDGMVFAGGFYDVLLDEQVSALRGADGILRLFPVAQATTFIDASCQTPAWTRLAAACSAPAPSAVSVVHYDASFCWGYYYDAWLVGPVVGSVAYHLVGTSCALYNPPPGTQLEVHSLTPLPTSQLMQVHHESL